MKCHKALAELGRRNAYKGVIADPLTNLARIYALIGEKDLALEKLDMISKLPFGPSYGQLRLDAEWDSLRGDPRFEKSSPPSHQKTVRLKRNERAQFLRRAQAAQHLQSRDRRKSAKYSAAIGIN